MNRQATCWVGGLTTAAETWSLCFYFAGIMRRIHLDPDGSHWNSLKIHTKCCVKHFNTQIILNTRNWHCFHSRFEQCALQGHLVSKQDHDGVAACSRRSVFDSEGVVVVPDDVKVDISLSWAYHSGSTFDSYTDITWENNWKLTTSTILSA